MKKCYYCEGNCPNEPKNSEFLCDGYAGDIDNLYVKKSISKKIEGNNMTKKDKLKKYSVTVSKTISVLASDEYEAEEQARADFDCTDLDCEVHDE